MTAHRYNTQRVCSKQIRFELEEDGTLHNVKFLGGGCASNLQAISDLVEGTDAKKTADLMRGNICGKRCTSCADQLARAIDRAFESVKQAQTEQQD